MDISIYWAIIFVVLVVVELIIPGLVVIWSAIAALVMVFVSRYLVDIKYQILVFLILSAILILLTKPFVDKFVKYKKDDNIIIGEEIEVVNVIKSNELYEVKYKGVIWTAISNEEYSANDKVKIKGFKGNKIFI